jgi:hypothetical protein
VLAPKHRRRKRAAQAREADDDDDEEAGKEAEEFEVCVSCGTQGEVMICDGCEAFWHAKCVPGLNGQVPASEEEWLCPDCADDGLERCERCGGRGEVMICDAPGCNKMFHLGCVPGLEAIPLGRWSCPRCDEARERGLVCQECLLPGDGTLVVCGNDGCKAALHLACARSYLADQLPGGAFCAACLPRQVQQRASSTARARVKLVGVASSRIEQCRMLQILRGDCQDLSVAATKAFLRAHVAMD